ncbi:MAG: flagellar hook-basal body complex protein [Pseudomonadota bacterium]
MSVTSALNAGVAGLSVNSTKLATISDNIANSSTNGYKRVDTEFVSLVSGGASTRYAAGGVRVETFRNVTAEGALVSTGNATDLTVNGEGLIPVTTAAGLNTAGSPPLRLTSTGSFNTDSNGFLRTEGGLFLLGWPANTDGSVTVPSRDSAAGLEPVQLNQAIFASEATTEINLGLNLPATETLAGASDTTLTFPVEYIDSIGLAQTLTFEFDPDVPATGRSDAWTVNVYDSADPTVPAVPVASFDVDFDATAASGGSIDAITNDGGAYDAATGVLTVPVQGGAIAVDIGVPGNSSLTQLAGDFAPVSVTRNGTPIGTVDRYEVSEGGFIEAVYDTGFRQTVYQIPIGDVANPNALRAEDGSAFSLTQDSGSIYFWDAASGPVGGLLGFTLEQSTTDITAELTDLIQTQRAYSSNARIIQTIDEVLQETTNLIR